MQLQGLHSLQRGEQPGFSKDYTLLLLKNINDGDYLKVHNHYNYMQILRGDYFCFVFPCEQNINTII